MDAKKVAADIAMGRADGELQELFDALVGRVAEIGAKRRWRVEALGLVVDEDNITLAELETAERLSGRTWLVLDPRQSARSAVAVLASALHHRSGVELVDAQRQAGELSALSVAASCSDYLADADPFPVAGSSS